MASSPAPGRLTVVATAFANPSIRRVLLAFGGFSLEAVTGQPASTAAADALVSERLAGDEAHASA
ncbi:MAG TPA: hypothetical protein VH987_04210 [Candidatus Limnocylindria bacterium]|jgi:hypothetical protein